MSGLILLFVLAVYAALVYWVATRFKHAWIRWVIVLAAVFGPFVESAIAKYRVASLCRAEFGVRQLRPVAQIKGLYRDGAGSAFPYSDIRRLGIEYEEYQLPDGKGYIRYSIGPGGEEVQEPISKPSARYELRDLKPVILPGNISRNELQLIDRTDGQVVAYGRQFVYAGDWFVRLLRKSKLPASSDIDCGGSVSIKELISSLQVVNDQLTTGELR